MTSRWSPSFFPSRSLAARLGLTFAALAMGMSLVLSYVEQRNGSAFFRADAERGLSDRARQTRVAMDQIVRERWRDLRGVSQFLVTAGPGRLASARRMLENVRRVDASYKWAGLASPDGTILTATDGTGERQQLPATAVATVAAGKSWVGPAHSGLLVGGAATAPVEAAGWGGPINFDVAVPVIGPDGRVTAILAATLDWSFASDARAEVEHDHRPREQGELLITAPDGTILLGDGAHAAGAALDLFQPGDVESAGATATRGAGGRDYLYAASPAQPGDRPARPAWVVVALQPADVAFAPVEQLRRRVWGGGVLGGAVFAAAGWLLAARGAKPVMDVAAAARRLAEGDLSASLPPAARGGGEAAILNASLGALASTVETQAKTLAAILNASPHLVFLLSTDARYLFASKAGAEFLGAPAEQLVGKTPPETNLPADQLDHLRREFDLAVEFVHEVRGEMSVVRPNGEERFYEHVFSPIVGADGRTTAVACTVSDVTARRAVERALRESHRRMAEVLDSISDAFYALDDRWRFTFVNRRAEQVWGRDRYELLGRNLWDEFPAARETLGYSEHLRAARERKPAEFEAASPGGGWVGVSVYPSENGGLSVYLRDITAAKIAEQALRLSENRLRLAVESTNIGTFDVDLVRGVQTWSDRAKSILGLPASAPAEPEQFLAVLHPDDRERVRRARQAAMDPAGDGRYEVEYRVIAPADGSERWVYSRGQVFFEEEGEGRGRRAVRFVGTTVDINDRKRAEQAAQFLARASDALASSLEYQQTVERAAEAAVPALADFCVVDVLEEEGRVTRVVAAADGQDPAVAEAIRRTPADLGADVGSGKAMRTGQPVVMLAVGADEDERAGAANPAHRRIARMLNTRSYMSIPLIARGQTLGAVTFIATRGRRRYDGADVPLAIEMARRAALAIAHAKAHLEARNALAAKDRFLAVLSHELRTPLTPALLTVSMLEENKALPADVLEDITAVRRNIELESRLIDDLLDLTRIARGKLRLDPHPADLHGLIRSAVEISRREDCAQVLLDLRATRHVVTGDGARLQQVFWNLLNNACKFTPPDGTVTVRTTDRTGDGDGGGNGNGDGDGGGDRVLVEVIDTGAGIEPDLLPKVFNAFEQGGDTARRFGGLGLGLAICKALVELHGGTIAADSAGPGTGATFRVELPALPAPPAVEAAPATPAQTAAARLRILLVEDHAATVNAMSRLLKHLGHDVRAATTVAGALAYARDETFDLVISDLGLPDGTGHEVIRAAQAKAPVKGIAVSGFGMAEDVRQSAEAGFSHHLVKPIDMQELQAVIAELSN